MHKAAPLLQGYVEPGCPVDCGLDWTKDHVVLMLKRDPISLPYARRKFLNYNKKHKKKMNKVT